MAFGVPKFLIKKGVALLKDDYPQGAFDWKTVAFPPSLSKTRLSVSLLEFMDGMLFGKTLLAVYYRFRLVLANALRKGEMLCRLWSNPVDVSPQRSERALGSDGTLPPRKEQPC